MLHHQNPDEVLQIIRNQGGLEPKDFKNLLTLGLKRNSVEIGCTLDQCQLISDWFSSFQNPFEAVNAFVDEPSNNFKELLVGEEDILRWHVLSQYISEDLLVCTKLAYSNDEYKGEFSWNPYLRINCDSLNELLSKPLADVHAHLKGSSLNFDVNWICLMNHICRRKENFELLDKWRQGNIKSRTSSHSCSLHEKAIIATAIRLYLFGLAKGGATISRDSVTKVIHSSCLLESLQYALDLQKEIDLAGYNYGREYVSLDKGKHFRVDYAINATTTNLDECCAYSSLSGERFIMYSTLRKLKSDVVSQSLFYLYLLIKNEVRKELVQLNDTVGFGNFDLYEKRKTLFVEDYKDYEELLVHLSVATFFEENETERLHETRIAPKSDYSKFVSSLKQTDRDIKGQMFGRQEKPWSYGFDYHFIKKGDDTCRSLLPFYERHHNLRVEVKHQAHNIARLVESNKLLQENHISQKIIGIDAANSEILTRPEVYAQAFRYLRNIRGDHPQKEEGLRLGITYHVGEDFVDVIDGLRALDELLIFMNYSAGDRLGHALVLGVNVKDYYDVRHYSVCMTRQMLLDNVAWLYHKLCDYGSFKAACTILKEKFNEQFEYIFGHKGDINSYYCSCLLRGDNPSQYNPDGSIKSLGLGNWNEAALNEAVKNIRNSKSVCKLYYRYHYDADVKLKGSEMTMFETDEKRLLVDAIEYVQTKLRKKVQNTGISIECNPTSNYKIGEIDRYDQHPLYHFYDYRNGKGYSHISSSINTDDKGIFSTSIEREYALIYAAFKRKIKLQRPLREKEPDIIQWLDEIREHSLNQCFLNITLSHE